MNTIENGKLDKILQRLDKIDQALSRIESKLRNNYLMAPNVIPQACSKCKLDAPLLINGKCQNCYNGERLG